MALFVGLAFEASGPLLTHLDGPFSDALIWFPLLVLCADRLSLGFTRHWPYCAVAIGLMLLGGEPEAAVSGLLFCGVFLVLRVALGGTGLGTAKRNLLWLLAAGLAAAGLVAVQILPYMEFLLQAAKTGHRHTASWIGPADLVVCILPRFLGPVAGHASSAHGAGQGSPVPALYVGFVSLWLLPLWFSLRRFPVSARRHRVEALLLTVLLMTAVSFVAGPLMRRVPLLRWVSPYHLLIGNALAIALAAAESADEWVELDADGVRATLRRLLVFAPVLAAAAGALVFARFNAPRHDAPDFVAQALVAGLFGLALLGLMATTLLRPSTRIMGYGLCVLAVIDLLSVFHPCLRFTDPERLFPETRFIATLKASGSRVSGTAALERWPLSGNLIPQVYSASGVRLARHDAFLSRVREVPLLLRRMGSETLLLTKQDIQGVFAGVRPLLAVNNVFESGAILFDDLGSKRRVYVAYTTREIEEFDPALLTPDSPALVEDVVPPPDAPGPEAEATIRDETNARVTIDVADTRPGVLVLADTWYPGWKATVDGTKTPVFPVDGISRGVLIGEGAHEVEFYYAPLSFRIGLAITIVTAVFLMAAMLRYAVGVFRQRRRWP